MWKTAVMGGLMFLALSANPEVARATAAISIVKSTNGQDADTAPGPLIPVGQTVSWTYLVTNIGGGTLSTVTVTDDQGVTVSCPAATLPPAAFMTCTASGTAIPGQYMNVGTATGTSPGGNTVTTTDPSHYFGVVASLDLEKLVSVDGGTVFVDADSPTGPTLLQGAALDPIFRFVLTNTGNVELSDISVMDNVLGAIVPPTPGVAGGDLGNDGNLGTTETWTVEVPGSFALGQNTNSATAVGSFELPGGTNGILIYIDIDDANYLGVQDRQGCGTR